jgi:acylpyruvate hydrolase
MLGKSFDTFGPMGPALVTPDEIPDPYDLEMELTVNGIPGQRVNTCDMIFSVPYLISYLSQVMTLEVGDVIATGTPAKLPAAAEQKRYLQAGDVVEITIEKLGTLRNPVQ